MKFLCIASMKKKKRGEESIFYPFSFLILPLSSRKALSIKSETTFSKQFSLNFFFFVFYYKLRNV